VIEKDIGGVALISPETPDPTRRVVMGEVILEEYSH
jgi:hypothetical protein